jgi:hypothetical protein
MRTSVILQEPAIDALNMIDVITAQNAAYRIIIYWLQTYRTFPSQELPRLYPNQHFFYVMIGHFSVPRFEPL